MIAEYGTYDNFILGALQNLGGSVVELYLIIDYITAAEATCNYDEIYYYYGRILNIVFTFDPVETGGNPLVTGKLKPKLKEMSPKLT